MDEIEAIVLRMERAAEDIAAWRRDRDEYARQVGAMLDECLARKQAERKAA